MHSRRVCAVWEIAETDIVLESILGEGASGTVTKGMWGHIPVAVKQLRVPLDDLDPQSAEDFDREVGGLCTSSDKRVDGVNVELCSLVALLRHAFSCVGVIVAGLLDAITIGAIYAKHSTSPSADFLRCRCIQLGQRVPGDGINGGVCGTGVHVLTPSVMCHPMSQ